MQASFEITSRSAALALASARPRAILAALMRQERSLGALHEALGLSLSLLHYHVARLRRLGLVRIVRREPRAGRPIAIYAAVAQAFVVPSALAAPAGESRRQLHEALARERARPPAAARVYELVEGGGLRMRPLGPEAPPSAGEWWVRLTLPDEQAAALVAEMRQLIGRYARVKPTKGKTRLLYFALART